MAQTVPESNHRISAWESAGSTSTLDLKVYRDVSTRDCPDATKLRQALFSHSVTLPREKLVLRIQFSRSEAHTVASIGVTGARSGTRVLQIPHENCSALIDPIAVALAMLLDSDASSDDTDRGQPARGSSIREIARRRTGSVPVAEGTPRVGEQPESTPVATTNTPERVANTSESKARSGFGVGLGAGPSLAIGLIPRVTYGLELEGQVRWQWASIRVQGAKYASDSVDFNGGQMRGQTQLGRLALCAERQLGRRFHGGACGAIWMGQLKAHASGFTSNGSVEPTLWAAGSVVEVTYRAYSHLGLYVQAAWLVPTAKHVFSVEGFPGEAFHSTPVAFTLSSGLWLKSL